MVLHNIKWSTATLWGDSVSFQVFHCQSPGSPCVVLGVPLLLTRVALFFPGVLLFLTRLSLSDFWYPTAAYWSGLVSFYVLFSCSLERLWVLQGVLPPHPEVGVCLPGISLPFFEEDLPCNSCPTAAHWNSSIYLSSPVLPNRIALCGLECLKVVTVVTPGHSRFSTDTHWSRCASFQIFHHQSVGWISVILDAKCCCLRWLFVISPAPVSLIRWPYFIPAISLLFPRVAQFFPRCCTSTFFSLVWVHVDLVF